MSKVIILSSNEIVSTIVLYFPTKFVEGRRRRSPAKFRGVVCMWCVVWCARVWVTGSVLGVNCAQCECWNRPA